MAKAETRPLAATRTTRNRPKKLRAAAYLNCEFDKEGRHIIEVYWSDTAEVRPELLACVTGLHHLRNLWLKVKFTDDDVGFLKSLTTLELLDLSGTRLSDQRLTDLRNLVHLKHLMLPRSRDITDAGLANLAALTELETLHLDGTGVRGEGLKHLQRMKKLKELYLENTRLDDNGLAIIGSLRSLTWLELAGTEVTDAGLPKLDGLSHLGWLGVRDTKVTRAGGERLHARLPTLDIQYPLGQRRHPWEAVSASFFSLGGMEGNNSLSSFELYFIGDNE